MKEEIQKFFKGEVYDDHTVLERYSRDASLFRVRPKLVVFPKDVEDMKNLVKFVTKQKKKNPDLSLTVRAAGSCMSGGSLNESIVADITRHWNNLLETEEESIVTETGVFYRNFEKKTLEKNLILPCYTASKNLCAMGGMIANNSAGEKTLRYGKMENFILESKVIFADGNEYTVKPLSKEELKAKMAQRDYEGKIYKKLFKLIKENREVIENARPNVSKNSAGYYLWNIYPEVVEGSEETFDLNKLIVGSQGTLGIVTEAKIKLVKVEPVSKLYVIFLPDLKRLSEIVNAILKTKPESIESYDDATLKLAFRFFPEMLRTMKVKNFFKLITSFIPEALMILRRGLPKLVLLVEYSGESDEVVDQKMKELEKIITPYEYEHRATISVEEADKYWTIRRESFNLLRKHVQGRRTAPFIDDVVVRPEDMPEFLPRMREILDSYKLVYTIAGHAGNGNFHIIPLMDMKERSNVTVIEEVGEKIYSLVAEYKGSITGEHNDGIVRTPYLHKMYSPEVLELFAKTKDIFDPENIFNPGKKVPEKPDHDRTPADRSGTLEYLEKHIALE
ncbi:MAG: FAD-binding oxidoreductase [Parcubacteria group bacterium]